MEKLNWLHLLLYVIILMICSSTINAYNLSWKVDKPVLQYGDDLFLFCQVDDCCLESAGWGKWISTNELTTIFIDVKDLDYNDDSKYYGKTSMSGFSLVIRNLSREDLDIAYSCTYGFLVSKKKVLLRLDAFNDIPLKTTTTTSTINNITKPKIYHSNEITQVNIRSIITIPCLAGGILVVVLLCACLRNAAKRKQEDKCESTEVSETSSTDTSERLYFSCETTPRDILRKKQVNTFALRSTENVRNQRESTGNKSTLSNEDYSTCPSSPSSFSRA